jgi:DNA-binding transcriptional LysR family regulator
MNLRQVRYFVAIARLGSLSSAAKELNVAQPALSHNIRSLENELGVPLLERHSRGVTPNDLGLMLLNHCSMIMREFDRIPDLVDDFTKNPAGEVKLGITTTAAASLIAPLLTKVHEDFPRITLHAVEGMSGTLAQDLKSGALDMAILYDATALESSEFVISPIMTEELYLVGSAETTLARHASVPFVDLSSFPLAIPSRYHTLATRLHATARTLEITLNVAFEVDSLTGMLELVRAGFYTIVSYGSVAKYVHDGEMVARPITAPPMQWTVYIVTAKKGVRSRSIRTVHGVVSSTMESMVESGMWRARLL